MAEKKVVEFGPARAIGLRYAGGMDPVAFGALWGQLMPRQREISRSGPKAAFGVCRCLPGVTDGSFEYLALLEAETGVAVPAGMMELALPRGPYLVIDVPQLSEVGAAWRSVPSALEGLKGYEPMCGPKGCGCQTAASSEYYPPDFAPEGGLQLYVALKPA